MSLGDRYCIKHGFVPCNCDANPEDFDEVTPARTPGSIQRIQQWGIIEAWLAENPKHRSMVLSVDSKGLRITAVEMADGGCESSQTIGRDEDPSRAGIRALENLKPAK